MLKDATFHHIGIAVASINSAKRFYLSAGYSVSDVVIEPVQKVYVSYAKKKGFPTIELLEPLDETSPIVNILKKNGGGYSISYMLFGERYFNCYFGGSSRRIHTSFKTNSRARN